MVVEEAVLCLDVCEEPVGIIKISPRMIIFILRYTVCCFNNVAYSALPETDGDGLQILSGCSQPHVGCVGVLWETEHFA